jgi:hypothetical protein
MTAHQRPNLRQAFIFLVKNTDRIKAPGYSAIGFIFLQIDALKFVLLGKTRSTKKTMRSQDKTFIDILK